MIYVDAQRVDYLTSGEYRRTLAVGDKIYVLNYDKVFTGVVTNINHGYIYVDWQRNYGLTKKDQLFVDGGSIVAVRLEDMNEDESSQLVTLRLSQ